MCWPSRDPARGAPGASGAAGGRVVLDPHGHGYLIGLQIPDAGPGVTWLWLETSGGPVRVGSIGDRRRFTSSCTAGSAR